MDTVAEKAGLQETRKGNVRLRKRIALAEAQLSRSSLDAGIEPSTAVVSFLIDNNGDLLGRTEPPQEGV